MKAAISIPTQRKPSLARAAFCAFLARGNDAHQRGADGFCRELYPDDRAALAIVAPETRATVTGATTTGAGWAAELVQTNVVGEFIASLPASAAAKLIARGVSIAFPPGAGSVRMPRRPSGPAVVPWVAEAGAIPARAWVLDTVTIAPKKMGLLVAFTRELQSEAVFRTMLQEDAALSIDAAYFSTDAATSAGHAGLLNGVTPTTLPGTASGTLADIMRDLAHLASVVNSEPGSSGETVFITGTAMAAQTVMVEPYFNDLIFPSAAVPANRIIAIDPKGIAHAFGDVVIESSKHSTIHMSDTPGTDISTATPSQSMFQTDMISLRLLIDVAFVKRRPGCVQYADRDWTP